MDDDNAFAAPSPSTAVPSEDGLRTAGSHLRIEARLIDGLVGFGCTMLVAGAFERAAVALHLPDAVPALRTYLFAAATVPFFAVQVWLGATEGSSIGKRFRRIRIVRADGRPPGFVRALVRESVMQFSGFLSVVAFLFWFVELHLTTKPGGRTLRDRLVGTRVVALRGPASG